MQKRLASVYKSGRPYMMAVVLGTALSTLPSAQARAGESSATAETTLKAIADMNRYCATCWRNARLPMDSWTDCTQEVFKKLLERVAQHDWDRVLHSEGSERREFLRAIDAVKKRTQRAHKYSGAVDAVADRHEQQSRQLADARELVHEAANELLSPRQQQILQMSFEGWSVQEMATELHLPAERVSDEKYKAIRKLREHLAEQEA
jgi:RNA polymerase sigma factor (sigma-70 family)